MGRSPWIDVVTRKNWTLQACGSKPYRISQDPEKLKAGLKPQYAIATTKLRRVHRLTMEIRYDVHYHVHITRGEAEKHKAAKAAKESSVPPRCFLREVRVSRTLISLLLFSWFTSDNCHTS